MHPNKILSQLKLNSNTSVTVQYGGSISLEKLRFIAGLENTYTSSIVGRYDNSFITLEEFLVIVPYLSDTVLITYQDVTYQFEIFDYKVTDDILMFYSDISHLDCTRPEELRGGQRISMPVKYISKVEMSGGEEWIN